jgi:endonuclease/exonuclease/phosphatase family metal-dependent hydrolase
MTFNARTGNMPDGNHAWQLRKSVFMDAVAAVSPDILCVQEALRFQLDDIRSAFPQFSEWGGARDDGWTGGEYCSILYNHHRFSVDDKESQTFWLSATPTFPSKGWDAACLRICTAVVFRERKVGMQSLHMKESRFVVYNTHLDHVSKSARVQGLQVILDHMRKNVSDSLPVILTGDFNSCPAEGLFSSQTFLKSKLLDVFASNEILHHSSKDQALSADACSGTFHGFHGGIPPVSERIDYVFVSLHWKVLRSYVDRSSGADLFPSDHYPVVAELFIE